MIRVCERIARCVAIVTCVLSVAGAAGAQTATKAPGPRIPLGGHVEFQAQAFELVSTPRAAIPFVPFKETEVLAMAPRDGKRQTPLGWQVRLKSGDWLPAKSYAAELSGHEKWLNSYGYTLREVAPTRGPGGRPPPLLKTNNLGLKFRLKPPGWDTKPGAPSGPGGKGPGGVSLGGGILNGGLARDIPLALQIPDFFSPHDPGIGLRRGGVLEPATGANRQKIIELSDGVLITAQPRSSDRRFTAAGLSDLGPALRLARGDSLASFTPEPLQAMQCKTPCTLTFGDGGTAWLTKIGQDIVADVVVKEIATCKVSTATTKQQCDKDAGPGGWIVHKVIRAREFYGYLFQNPAQLSQFLASFGKPCDMRSLLSFSTFDTLYDFTDQSSGGTVTQTQGAPPKTFWEGTLNFSVAGASDCLGRTALNGWFGASLCLNYASLNKYTPSAGFDISNSAGARAKTVIFGLTDVLIDGSHELRWVQPMGGGGAAEPKPATKVVDPNINTTLNPQTNSEHYDGPSATFLLGPVPLTITSYLDASMTVGKSSSVFTAAPLAFKQGDKGDIKAGVGIGGDINIGLEASADAFVAKVGIDGKLTLFEADLIGSMGSTIQPPINDVTVTQAYTFSGAAMKGTISAFLEIDLLVTSKRWSVEIISFDGIPIDPKPVTKTFHGKAVIPASATPATPTCN
ncbi:hypothetical protein [Caulobacter hibisci]|uniref:AsmA-like C-terminal domain-containing protein n=1 Tax=Caulobacter hibisci TaxID=2035993 RepID=A0ABS0T365_9CAUL|nr:hypothetical protein [Caulobacter hibisci]MBI1686327.1 hypothetical protein [Caulobacter hibisci]